MVVKDLDIDLNVLGWDVSGGKSFNVWGRVPSSNLPLQYYENVRKADTKSAVWTAYDAELLKGDDIPDRISATYKSSFDKYSHVCENMSMRLAVALGIPTSYNYIVNFESEKYDKILKNYPININANKVKSHGLVSVDFLQPDERLHEFYDLRRCGQSLSVENWINKVSGVCKDLCNDMNNKNAADMIKKVNSRIASSVLFRELVGDADFTDKNCGIVVNEKKKTVKYAPNYDYGESFNALIQNKFINVPKKLEDYSEEERKSLEIILKYQPNYLEIKAARANVEISELATHYASAESQNNIKWVLNNYPDESFEFLQSLENIRHSSFLNDLTSDYTKDDELLTQSEGNMFLEYLTERVNFLDNTILSHFRENDMGPSIL